MTVCKNYYRYFDCAANFAESCSSAYLRMLKNKGRLWNAVRSLRGKKDTMPAGSRDDSDAPSAKDNESELEKRVRQWQSESFPPREFRSPQASLYAAQNQDHYFQASQQMDCAMGDVDKAGTGVLYHPDFADWDSIHPDETQDSRRSSLARTGADDLIQVLDDAKETLAKLLVVPFSALE